MKNFKEIVDRVNEMAPHYDIGKIHDIRAKNLCLSRRPRKLFGLRTTDLKENYAYHIGGRCELQFNIGFDRDNKDNKDEYFRYGVAFSFELSRSYTDLKAILSPKVKLFNEYIDNSSEEDLSDFMMWCHDKKGGKRSDNYFPSPIPEELIDEKAFVFLGNRQKINKIDYQEVLETLDRLLPIYLYIEDAIYRKKTDKKLSGIRFKPGCTVKPSSTTGSIVDKQLDIRLRHNDMQYQLYKKLAEKYGEDSVGTEICINGSRVDIVIKHKSKSGEGNVYWFYEIKTASTAKACIREALGQLLEYCCWSYRTNIINMYIVGEPKATKKERMYMMTLRASTGLPLWYLSSKSAFEKAC